MKSVFPMLSALLKSWLRSKTSIFFSFLFPAMLLIIFSTIFGGTGSGEYTLFVQNFDVENGTPTELSQGFIGALESTGVFDIQYLDKDVDVRTYVKENPSFYYSYRILVIPEGLESNALNKSMSVRIGVLLDTFALLEEQFSTSMSESDLESIRTGQTMLTAMELYMRPETPTMVLLTDEQDMAAPALAGLIHGVADAFSNNLIGTEEVVALTSEFLEQRTLEVADYFLPGFIAAFIMTNGIIGATSTISEYRRDGQVKRLAATPLPKISWILGNILQQTVLAFMLTGLMIVLAWVLFDVRVIPDVYALSLIFVGAVAFCSVGMVLGGVIKDVEAANGAGNAIAFPMMFLSGAFFPIEQMPEYLQTVAKFLPLHYFHDGLLQIMIYENPGQSFGAFVILGVFAVLSILLALKMTKWKEF